jgi:protein TonB
MSEVLVSDFGFDGLLSGVLRSRRREAEAPAGLEQRLKARLALEEAELVRPQAFGSAEAMRERRSAASLWGAIGLHAAAAVVLVVMVSAGVHVATPKQTAVEALTLPPPPARVQVDQRGGGGQQGAGPVTTGHLPRAAAEQLMPPKAPPVDAARLAVEPTVVMPNVQMAQTAPNLGDPASTLHGYSLGTGRGTGIGQGDGPGVGEGSGGDFGGGVMHPGGEITKPDLIYAPDPEFSEEARRAKFSGNVLVYLWVDEHGNPSHVRVIRGIGMGLDEKAVEAVRQYKFKPAMLHGKPVKVDMDVDVDFHIF